MFIVMFNFVVKKGFEKQFLESWPRVTQGIYLFKGSLGSRLHRDKNGKFIAYAQWPNREIWEKSNELVMSAEYELEREKMNSALNLETTETVYEMEVEYDYLQRREFGV